MLTIPVEAAKGSSANNARGSESAQLSVDTLRHLIRQEVDRRLEQVGFWPGKRQSVQVAEADEVAGTFSPAYDAGDWPPPGILADLALLEPELDVRPSLVDEDGEPLPSNLPEIAESSLSTAEAASRLGVNDSRIRQRLGDGSLYGFKFGGSWRLPKWQFEGSTSVPHLDEVIEALRPNENPVGVTRWFISPWEDLLTEQGELLSPRRWLLEGRDPDPVIAQAKMP